jgi:hypothetical protein
MPLTNKFNPIRSRLARGGPPAPAAAVSVSASPGGDLGRQENGGGAMAINAQPYSGGFSQALDVSRAGGSLAPDPGAPGNIGVIIDGMQTDLDALKRRLGINAR